MELADLLRMTFSLLGIVLLLLAIAWLIRKGGWNQKPAEQDIIKLVSAKRMGTRGSIALIEIADTRLVLGITSQTISLLHTSPAGTNSNPANSKAKFKNHFQRSIDGDSA